MQRLLPFTATVTTSKSNTASSKTSLVIKLIEVLEDIFTSEKSICPLARMYDTMVESNLLSPVFPPGIVYVMLDTQIILGLSLASSVPVELKDPVYIGLERWLSN